MELGFTADKVHKNPWTDVSFSARFSGPGNINLEVPGFWDGGKLWKIRFAPTAPGKWSYKTSCPVDTGLDNQAGMLKVGSAQGDNPLYRHGGVLKVSENNRYLTCTDGTPFFWLGDTWWFCPSYLVPFDGSSNPEIKSAYKTLIDLRKRQGFTVVQMAFIGGIRGTGYYKDYFKTGKMDVKYWQLVDRYIDYANQAGIIPSIALDFSINIDTDKKLKDWKTIWRYVIARYGAHAVIWLISGEYNTKDIEADAVQRTLKLGQFIKDTDAYKRAMTIHPLWFKGEKRQAWDQPWYDFIMFQGAHEGLLPPVDVYLNAWRRSPAKPVFEAESRYEGLRGYTDDGVREVAYRAIQAGSFGFTYAAHGLWYPTQNQNDDRFEKAWGVSIPWWQAMNRPGGQQMSYLRRCYESVHWWQLEPKPDAIKTDKEVTERHRILAKADSNHEFVIYFPGQTQKIKAKLTGLKQKSTSGIYSVELFNPRDGSIKELREVKPKDGQITLPQRPSDKDWLLILRLKD